MSDDRPIHGPDAFPEGEERAPPGTRTMAIVRWALVGLMAVAAVGAWSWYAARAGVVVAERRWHCPMHPQIVTAQRGECPICGMDLVPAGEGAGTPAPDAAARAAPEPAAASAAGPGAEAARYTCPMHPDFVTPDPKARCPHCGMTLVPSAPAAPRPPAAQGVPGLAPVELAPDRIRLAGLRTAVAARHALSPTLRTVGFVTANEDGLVSVTTRYSGWIESLAIAQTGQPVRKGDVLATVYSPDMANAQQVFLNAVKWSERAQASAPAGAAAPAPAAGAPAASTAASDLERDARNRLVLAGVAPEDVDAIARAGQPLQALNVRAPVRGYIARKSAIAGLYVTPGTELFRIADLSTVWVLADVYEREMGRVRVGQRASFEVAAYPGERFAGRVQLLYPALNPGTRTLQARVELANPRLRLRPGMYGDVTLELGAADAVVVPRDAVVDTGELQYVFVARGGGRFEPRRVRAGLAGEDRIAIVEGLAEGEEVVTAATFLLDSESRLRAALER